MSKSEAVLSSLESRIGLKFSRKYRDLFLDLPEIKIQAIHRFLKVTGKDEIDFSVAYGSCFLFSTKTGIRPGLSMTISLITPLFEGALMTFEQSTFKSTRFPTAKIWDLFPAYIAAKTHADSKGRCNMCGKELENIGKKYCSTECRRAALDAGKSSATIGW